MEQTRYPAYIRFKDGDTRLVWVVWPPPARIEFFKQDALFLLATECSEGQQKQLPKREATLAHSVQEERAWYHE